MGTRKDKSGKITFTKKGVEQIRKLAPYLTQEQIADFFGMGERTFRRILDRDEKVVRAYREGKADVLSQVAENLVRRALDGNITASIFYLKTRGGWSEVSRHEIKTETSDGPTEIVIRSVLPNTSTEGTPAKGGKDGDE